MSLDKRLDFIFQKYSAVGGAVVAARNGQIFLRYTFGYENRADKTPISLETHFRIASVTKLISAVRVMQLVEASRLSLDEDISAYLGYPVANPYTGEALTLRMLMSHTSSLAGKSYKFPNHTLRQLIGDQAKSRNRFLNQSPGSGYVYSNLGAGVMGSLIEIVDMQNADASVQEHIFTPLGMDAGYSMKALSPEARIASLYNQDGTLHRGPAQWAVLAWDDSCDPESHFDLTVGDLLIKPEDLCRLGIMFAAGGEVDGIRLLRSDTVQAMAASQKGNGGITAESPYGLCIHRDTHLLPDRTLYGHQGHMWGTLASLYWDPYSGLVIAILSNGCNLSMDDGTSRLAEDVWRLLAQEEEENYLVIDEDEEEVFHSADQNIADPQNDSGSSEKSGIISDTDAEKGTSKSVTGRLSGLKIGIDPGHQAQPNREKEAIAPGSKQKKAKVAKGTAGTASGIPEYVTNLEISFALRDALAAEGAEVLMTRESHDTNLSNQERAIMLNDWGADLVLRIHCNGSSRASVHGIGLYVNKSFEISAESYQAAQCLLPRIIEATGAKSKGISRRDTYTGLNWSTVPSILVECGYLTNPAEEEKLSSQAYQMLLAQGLLEGICDYFEQRDSGYDE